MFLAHVENKKPPRGKSKIPTWKSVFPDTAPYRYFWLLAIGASTPMAPKAPITPMALANSQQPVSNL